MPGYTPAVVTGTVEKSNVGRENFPSRFIIATHDKGLNG
jgi:hypothetical protein